MITNIDRSNDKLFDLTDILFECKIESLFFAPGETGDDGRRHTVHANEQRVIDGYRLVQRQEEWGCWIKSKSM